MVPRTWPLFRNVRAWNEEDLTPILLTIDECQGEAYNEFTLDNVSRSGGNDYECRTTELAMRINPVGASCAAYGARRSERGRQERGS